MKEVNLSHLLEELERAVDECWASKIAAYEITKKNAYLCVQIIQELGYVPHLANKRLEKRKKETDGMDYLREDFWCDQDLIIALFEHFEDNSIKEVQNACA